MVTRLIDSAPSELFKMNKKEKIESIQLSEGRSIVAELTTVGESAMPNASLGELYAAFGADIILLNMFDVYKPYISNIKVADPKQVIKELKRLTGKLVGVNLEPASEEAAQTDILSEGRIANTKTIDAAAELGVDFIVLTGNPHTGVTNAKIAEQISQMAQETKDKVVIIAGKMHAAGSLTEAGEKIISKDDILKFKQSGADVVLIPAPGTVPGITSEFVHEMVSYAHSLGLLTLTSIGTSQEDCAPETLREIALMCKMCGTDLHHIGDAGYAGAVPESVFHYSVAVRGKRHTYNRMAISPLR